MNILLRYVGLVLGLVIVVIARSKVGDSVGRSVGSLDDLLANSEEN